MELLSVHSIGSVVELNVPYLFVPSQSNGGVSHALDQYIYDEVSALKREYMQPWMDNDAPLVATVTENSLVMSPSSLTKYMTEDDIKQAEELEIKPGEETKDITVTNLDPPKSPRSRLVPPPPKFAPPAPPQNGLEIEEETLMVNGANGKRPRRHRRNTSQSSNASVSSTDVINSNNNNNNGSKQLTSVGQSPRHQMNIVANGTDLARPKVSKVHRSRRNRNSIGKTDESISNNGNCNESIGSTHSTLSGGETVERIDTVSLNQVVDDQGTNKPQTKGLAENGQGKASCNEPNSNFKKDRSFRRSGKRRSLKKKNSNGTSNNRKTTYSSDSLTDDTMSDAENTRQACDRDFSASSDSEYDLHRTSRRSKTGTNKTVPDIQVTEASSE